LQQISANVLESRNRVTLELVQKWLKAYDLDFIGLRDLFVPDEGMVLICADYNQQELRILAHFLAVHGDKTLMRAYHENPKLDIHEFFRQLVHKEIGILYERKYIKIAVFGIIYGMGVGKLADMMGVEQSIARTLRNGIYKAVPGIRDLMDEFKRMAAHDEPLITWGGRQYFCEEPRIKKDTKELMSFEYKMLNYEIQPSAADCTKQGMLNVRDAVPEARIAIQVHDELVCMAPSKKYGPMIAEAMCDVKFKVPMLADVKYSTESWARVE
jgi:DNA polymerase-1